MFLKDKSKEIKKKYHFVENFRYVTKKELKSKALQTLKYMIIRRNFRKTLKTQFIYHKYIKRIRHKIEKLYKIKATKNHWFNI